MSFEQYQNIYHSPKNGIVIRPKGDAAHFSFSMTPEKEKCYKLFVTGETTLFYQWKDEPDYQAHYHTITDALDTVHANRAQYCLDFSCDTYEDYIKRVYKQVNWPPILSYLAMNPVHEEWQAGLWVKTENLDIAENGYLHMHLEIRYLNGQVYAPSTELPPDEEYIIPIESGTRNWTMLSKELKIIKEKTASVCVWIEGRRYRGKVYLESPFLVSEADLNLLPDFSVPVSEKEKFQWTAQNLSQKEWPKFSVALNGETIFEGARFERCHRHSEWEIELPSQHLKSENQISISLISDYHDPLPYEISEVSVLTQPNELLSVLSVTEIAPVGGKAYALVRTTQENTTVTVRYLSASISGKESYFLKEAGLHGISIDCISPALHADFELTACGITVPCHIPRIVHRENDGVLTGTGDMLYILQDEKDMEEYLCWYVSNHIGNLITVRPSYRWSGTRVLNDNVWKQFVRIANELGLRYVLMRDGRELPGFDCNPIQELEGEGYLGAQIHERDGQFFYWSPRKLTPINEAIYAMKRRTVKENPAHANMPVKPSEYLFSDGIYTNRNPYPVYDTKITAEETVRDLAAHRENISRHTGPSWSQKYFADAGFQWLGAETMYSSMEPQMAFMRGTCKYSGQTDIGVHHATQWSSTPHDAEEHYRRLRLALYVAYMQGATESNIEEGLWHLEEYYSHFHRFSDCCLNHTKQQQDFYRYVQSHARTGVFRTPFAVLQGRYDGAHGFIPTQPWGWVGVSNTEAEESWELLQAIYPNAKPGTCLYLHGCATDHAVGYYSGTPYGNVDVLPAECKTEQFAPYGALAFLGYNCAEDMDNLVTYVKNGGTLMLTYAHLTHTTLYKDIAENRRCYQKQALSFSEDTPVFASSTYHSHAISVCSNLLPPDEVLETTDDGKPFVCKYALGSGTVILFCADAYPAHPAIRPLYESALSGTMQALCKNESVWASTGDDVEFAVYQQEDGSCHVYFLAVDWYRNPDTLRQAELRIGADRYTVSMPFGTMIKCVAANGIGAWPHTEEGEVLSVNSREVTVQGVGTITFSVAANGTVQKKEIDFSKHPIQTISL